MEKITAEEKKEFQQFLSVIYGDQALNWNINLKVLELFGELLRSSDACSRYMDMVPKPFLVGNAIKWASKQARQAVIRHLKNGGKHYLTFENCWVKQKNRFCDGFEGILSFPRATRRFVLWLAQNKHCCGVPLMQGR